MALEIGQVVQQQTAQPGQQLGLGVPLEAREVAVRFEKRLLNQVGCSPLGLKVGIESVIGDAQQVSPAGLQGLA